MQTTHIYVDESEISGNLMLGAVLVPDKHRYAADRHLTTLRRKMLRVMQVERYPILDPERAGQDRTSRQRTERARLAAGGLPEIHAAELWSSDEVFWKERDGTPQLRDRHLGWLREALEVVARFELTYTANTLSVERQAAMVARPEADLVSMVEPLLTKDISRKKVRELQKDPFVRMLFGLMQGLERFAQQDRSPYSLTVDRGKKNEMFRTFETFSTLKQHGSWQWLQGIDFQHSHDSALVQLADVVTYVRAKALWLPTEHKDKPLATHLWQRYLRQRQRPLPEMTSTTEGFFPRPSLAYAELVAMLTEMALLYCGGTGASLPERRARLAQMLAGFPEVFQHLPQSPS